MTNNDLTLLKVLNFFRVFSGDQIKIEKLNCGIYTELFTEIVSVGYESLQVRINSNDVDEENLVEISIGSIKEVHYKRTRFRVFDMDIKVDCLRAFILKNRTSFNDVDQKSLDNLFKSFELFFNEIISEEPENSNFSEREIDRRRFDNLFIGL